MAYDKRKAMLGVVAVAKVQFDSLDQRPSVNFKASIEVKSLCVKDNWNGLDWRSPTAGKKR
jgi:hypothetical protein